MLVGLLLLLLVSHGLSYAFPSHFFHLDGRYCFELADEDKTQGRRCNYFVDLRTKYPFIIVSYHLGEEKDYDDKIKVVKPALWPGVGLRQPDNITIEFMIENLFQSSQLNLPPPFKTFYNSSDISHFTLNTDGILELTVLCPSRPPSRFTLPRVESHSLKNVIRNNLCDVNNALPGRWKIDLTFNNYDDDKWSTCPNNHKNRSLYHCPTHYYAAQYYPDSGCSILPLRLSLHLLYRYFERDNILIRSVSSTQKNVQFNYPFYTFIGDSLNGQIMEAGKCELESHDDSLSIRKQYYQNLGVSHSSGLDGNDITIFSLWNQYLRNDSPCQPLSEAFEYLQKIPLETRIVVINGGALYPLVQNGTTLFQETLEALLPQLAKLQRQRNYQLDLYFLTLPGAAPTAEKKTSFDWGEYEKRNRIISDVFSESSMAKYNITVTLIRNDQLFFDRRSKVDGEMIYTPDRLHYCVPGAFSPPSFLFEVILHFHVRNRLKQEGLID